MEHYVYIHFKTDTLEPFYIGKGTKNRINSKTSRNLHWKNIVNKHGLTVDFLKYFYSHQEALDYEVEMIAFFAKENFKLCNQTGGGEGSLGRVLSPESLLKFSLVQQGKKLSEETKAKLSLAAKGRSITEQQKQSISLAQKGKIVSEETRVKLSIAGSKPRSKRGPYKLTKKDL